MLTPNKRTCITSRHVTSCMEEHPTVSPCRWMQRFCRLDREFADNVPSCFGQWRSFAFAGNYRSSLELIERLALTSLLRRKGPLQLSSSGQMWTPMRAKPLHAPRSISAARRIKANHSLIGCAASAKPGVMQNAWARCVRVVFALTPALSCQITQSGIGANTLRLWSI